MFLGDSILIKLPVQKSMHLKVPKSLWIYIMCIFEGQFQVSDAIKIQEIDT